MAIQLFSMSGKKVRANPAVFKQIPVLSGRRKYPIILGWILAMLWGLLEGMVFGQSPYGPASDIRLVHPPEVVQLPPPVEPPAVPETLEEAWLAAIQGDQRFEASRWNYSAAKSGLAAARSEYLPSLNLGADYLMLSQQPTYNLNLPLLPTIGMPLADRDSAGAHGLVTQPLFTSGRISSGVNAAAASVRANESEVNRTMLEIKINVAEIYVTVLRAIRISEVAESKVASLTAHNRVVTDHFEKGVVSKNDLLAAQVALADAQQQALEARNGLEVARSAYNRSLNRDLTTPVLLTELQDTGELGDIYGLTRCAMQMRPEIAGLSAQATALREQAASVQAKKSPQVALLGGYVYQENSYIDPNGIGVLAVGVEWNAFDSGRVRNQADALAQRAEAVLRMRKDVESQIALEVRQKWLDLQTARERVQVAYKATAQADENLRVARDRYEQQVGTNTEVLDAEALRVQAYTNFYNSTYQAVLAGLRLRRAVGNL
jgi:outer membrane protein